MIRNRLLLFIFCFALLGCTKESVINPNLLTTGSSSHDLLSDDDYSSLHIEVAYVAGYKPSDKALETLHNFLNKRIYKPNGISFQLTEVPSPGKATYSIEEIAKLEKNLRTSYNEGEQISVWIFFVDGSNNKDNDTKETLGSAFRNTSIVIYEKSIIEFANHSGSSQKEVVETVTLEHEFGHLFGLVNLGAPLLSDHEDPDPDYANHCITSGCLMNGKLEFGSGIIDVTNNSNIPELKDACLKDLRAGGGK